MLKLIAILSVLVSTMSMAETLPVDEAIAGLRAKADHLEMLKTLLQNSKCSVSAGGASIALDAGALRDNGIVIAITDTLPGNYLAFSQAPKPHMLKNVVAYTFKRPVNRVMIVSASLVAKPGATEFTHLKVKVAEPEMQKDVLDPETLKPTLGYAQYPLAIPLTGVKGGHTSQALKLKNGGTFQVVCK